MASKSQFTHVHTHSHFSLLDGLGKIPDLVDRAKELGMDSLAITDHGVMYGAVEFYQACKDKGIKPIIGVEAYLAQRSRHDKSTKEDGSPHHQILLAANEEGYKNLCKLTTIAHIEGYYYKPQIDKECLKQYSNGLIATSACLAGAIPRAIAQSSGKRDLSLAKKEIEEFLEIFGEDRFFLEVQHNPTIDLQRIVNDGIFELADEFNLKAVVTGDIHYVNKEDADTHDILICVQTGRTVDEEDRMSYLPETFYMQSADELAKEFPDHPEIIENTKAIADQCSFEFELGENKLPVFEVPDEHTEFSYLKELCKEGLEFRYGSSDPETLGKDIMERLAFELETIEKMGFAGYFLIVQDYIVWAKQQGIVVGPGRGSAAGSIVTFLLRITDIDPLKYDLLFERFLNPDRISMPDIDTDFADDRRDEVIHYVAQKYGKDHVAQIITFGTMAARAAVRDCGRALGLAYSFCDRVSKLIPMFTSLSDALDSVTELKELYNDDTQVKKLIDNAIKLEGVCRHASTHACAVVIAPEPLSNLIPCQIASKEDDSIVTQYEMHAVEELGLLKMDFLGLKNLTIIDKAIRLIEVINDVTIDIDNLPMDDQQTYELFQKGQTTGVFQFESSGMKRWLKQLRPTEFEDVIAMVALYRPGPMEFIPDYIGGKHGTKKVTYLHPLLQEIIGNTYGVAIYQEQIMNISRKIALFTPGEADTLRKGMGKKIKEVVDKMHGKFIEGAQKNNVDKKTAQAIWEFIEPFASYGFNRSHAACYALIGYQTAYLKANYPAEFMAALLTADQGNTDRVAIEVDECRQMGIEVSPPDINESFKDFTVIEEEGDKKSIRFGLGAIKNVGEGIITAILAAREEGGKFASLEDVLQRVISKDLNRKSMESLARCGAFDSLAERNMILENMDTILAFSKELQREAASGQKDLFGNVLGESMRPKLTLDEVAPAKKRTRLDWEKELLGLYVSDHPVKEYANYLQYYALGIHELTSEHVDFEVTIGGIVTEMRKIITKKGDPMAFVNVEDLKSKVEILVFPKVFEKKPDMWEEGKIVLIDGVVNDKDGSLKVLVESADIITEAEAKKELPSEPLTTKIRHPKKRSNGKGGRFQKETPRKPLPQQSHGPRALFLRLPANADQAILQNVSSILAGSTQGFTSTYIVVDGTSPMKKIKTPHKIEITPDVLQQCVSVLGDENVKTI